MAKAAKKQLTISGTERKTISEVNHAAEAYRAKRDERMELSRTEKDAKTALIAVMKKHDLEVYRDDEADPPLIITRVPGEDGIKVTEVIEVGDDSGGEE